MSQYLTPTRLLEIAGLPVTRQAIHQLTESTRNSIREAPASEKIQNWEIADIPGEGRGNAFDNEEQEFTHQRSGLRITSWDGYDDEDDEDWDDFGNQYYTCTATGTRKQARAFIEDVAPKHLQVRGHRTTLTLVPSTGEDSTDNSTDERKAKNALKLAALEDVKWAMQACNGELSQKYPLLREGKIEFGTNPKWGERGVKTVDGNFFMRFLLSQNYTAEAEKQAEAIVKYLKAGCTNTLIYYNGSTWEERPGNPEGVRYTAYTIQFLPGGIETANEWRRPRV